jgi:hypothetical protein
MNKKVLMEQLFIMVCAVVESKDTPYAVGIKLIEKALNNDISYLDELPDTVSDAFTEIHQDVFKVFNLLTEQDKKMISNNIYKEMYLMLQNIDKAYDTNLTYVERTRGKYTATLKQVLVNVLMAYIGEGISLKSQYEAFKTDYEKYATVHMGPISRIADTPNRPGLKEAMVQREGVAVFLIKKYGKLKLTKCDLRTPLEDERIWGESVSLMTREQGQKTNINNVAV